MAQRSAAPVERSGKSPSAYRTISEVAVEIEVPQHVLRFWETKFSQIRPLKRGGGRRYYRPEDVELLRGIRHLLYSDGYTIKGVQKLLRENGAVAVIAAARPLNARLADLQEAEAPETGQGEVPPAAPESLEGQENRLPEDAAALRLLLEDLREELAEIRQLLARGGR